jgi:hypothetical protein
MKRILLTCFIAMMSIGVHAASIYVDIGDGNGTPSTGYSAKASVGGEWNLITTTNLTALVDIGGNSTATTFQFSSSLFVTTTGTSGFNSAPGDVGALADDNFYVNSSRSGTGWSINMTNIENGDYRLWLYSPGNGIVHTGNMDVNGISVGSLKGDSSVNPSLGGDKSVYVDLVVTDGMLSIVSDGSQNYEGLAGLQLVAVPIPAAVWLFGSALAGLGWMRRKQSV